MERRSRVRVRARRSSAATRRVYRRSSAEQTPDGAPYRRASRGGHDELLYQVQLDGKRSRRHRSAIRVRHVRREPGRIRSRRYDRARRVDAGPLHRQHVRVFRVRGRRGRDGRPQQVFHVLPKGPHVLHQIGGRQGGAIGRGLRFFTASTLSPYAGHRDSRQRVLRRRAIAPVARQIHVEGGGSDRRSLEHPGARIDPLFSLAFHAQHRRRFEQPSGAIREPLVRVRSRSTLREIPEPRPSSATTSSS